MSLTKFDLRKLITNHYIGLPYPEFLKEKIINNDIDINDIGKSDVTNNSGLPFFMDVYLTLPDIGKVRLPNEPLISWSFRNNIVKTVTAGGKRRGTVKEFISADDYYIDIKGICIKQDNSNSFPTEQVELIKKISEVDEAIKIENDILQIFGIYNVVVESASYADMQGIQGAQFYNIKLISDTGFYAELKNKNLNDL